MGYRKKYRFLFLLFIPLVVGLLAAAVMLLWNAILPEVLGVRRVSYGQALGLLVLSRILFGGSGGGGSPPWKKYRRRGRWAQMSDEEKARMREAWQRRCHR